MSWVKSRPLPSLASHGVILFANFASSILTFISCFYLPSPRVSYRRWVGQTGGPTGLKLVGGRDWG